MLGGNGVEAYFSRCLTLTFQRAGAKPSRTYPTGGAHSFSHEGFLPFTPLCLCPFYPLWFST